MNRSLLNPFEASDLPRAIKDYLGDEKATCMRFNRHGNILAVGTITGRVVLWDFDTRTKATVLADDLDNHNSPVIHTDDNANLHSNNQNHFARPRRKARAKRIVSLTFLAPGNASAVVVAYETGALRVYHTLSGRLLCHVDFDVGLHQVEAHPKIESIVIVVPTKGLPLLLHLRRGHYQCSVFQLSGVHNPALLLHAPAIAPSSDSDSDDDYHDEPPPPPKTAYGNRKISFLKAPVNALRLSVLCTPEEFASDSDVSEELTNQSTGKRRPLFCIGFTRKQRYVLRAGPTGLLRIFSLQVVSPNQFVTAICVSSVSVQGRAPIRSLTVSRLDRVLINSYDRCMRLYFLEDLVAVNEQKDSSITDDSNDIVMVASRVHYPIVLPSATFSEIVNRAQCRTVCFSLDSDFVIGGVDGPQHRIHIWRVHDGQIDVTLEGPKEGVGQLLIHPLRPVIVSLGAATGGVYIWDKEVSENWSAFSTQFSELEANEEYEEKEDEFDLLDVEGDTKFEQPIDDEDVEVDVVGSFKHGWFNSDSEEEDTFFYVPAIPMPDNRGGIPLLSDAIIARREEELSQVALAGDEGEEVLDQGPGGRRRRPSSTCTSKSSVKRLRSERAEPSASSAVVVDGNGIEMDNENHIDTNGIANGDIDTERRDGSSSASKLRSTIDADESLPMDDVEESILDGGAG